MNLRTSAATALLFLAACAPSPDDGIATSSSAATAEGSLLRGCATAGADQVCLERRDGRELVTYRDLDHAPATRTERRITVEEIPALPGEPFTFINWSRTWDEIVYRAEGTTLTFLVGADQDRQWPVVLRASGTDAELWPTLVPFATPAAGTRPAGCADVRRSFHVFGPPSVGRLCAQDVADAAAVITLDLDGRSLFRRAAMTREETVTPMDACIDPFPFAHVCRPVTAQRSIAYRGADDGFSVNSYDSEWGFDVELMVGENTYVLAPSFTP